MHLGSLELRGGVFKTYAQQQDALCAQGRSRVRESRNPKLMFFFTAEEILNTAILDMCVWKRETLSSRNVKNLEEKEYMSSDMKSIRKIVRNVELWN